ncbi:MAG: substrate-binding periplasmic protein [Candidatus Promineifilaceae bacterium]|jgi:polar amino acid transport system substrate-binding protein
MVAENRKTNFHSSLFSAGMRISLLIFIILALLFLTGCGRKDDTWQRIQKEGILRVGLDPTFPPFEVTADSDVIGLDADLARALADEMGLQAEFVYFGYDGLYDALATEQVDFLISALVIVPGRMRDFAYSEPYFNAGEILVIPSGSTIDEMAGLSGKRLAVELGAQGHVEATQWAKRLPDLQVLPYPSADEALDAVAAGEADAALVDGVSGRLYLKERSNLDLERVSQTVTVEPYAMVVRIEDETLLAKLDEALSSLTATGELDILIERWLGP